MIDSFIINAGKAINSFTRSLVGNIPHNLEEAVRPVPGTAQSQAQSQASQPSQPQPQPQPQQQQQQSQQQKQPCSTCQKMQTQRNTSSISSTSSGSGVVFNVEPAPVKRRSSDVSSSLFKPPMSELKSQASLTEDYGVRFS